MIWTHSSSISGNRVWINDGNGTFTDSGQSLGNHVSLDVSLGDVDGDGDLDAFVANFDQGNRVWINDGGGTFTDSGQSLGNHGSTGVSLGDVTVTAIWTPLLPTLMKATVCGSMSNQQIISITKTSNQVAVVQGSQVTYTIVVANHGPGRCDRCNGH